MVIQILFGIFAFGNDFKTIVNDFTWKILNSRVQTLRILPLTHNQNTFDRKNDFELLFLGLRTTQIQGGFHGPWSWKKTKWIWKIKVCNLACINFSLKRKQHSRRREIRNVFESFDSYQKMHYPLENAVFLHIKTCYIILHVPRIGYKHLAELIF